MSSSEKPTNKDTGVVFGQRVRAARLSKNWSQEQLAEKSEVHPNFIGYIERGQMNISLTNMEQIANALGVKVSGLLP